MSEEKIETVKENIYKECEYSSIKNNLIVKGFDFN